MGHRSIISFSLAVATLCSALFAAPEDIHKVKPDLEIPALVEGAPKAGQRVRVVTEQYKDTEVYHVLYLPRDWQAGKRYPVIVEYAGNGPYRNRQGDVCTGKVDDCKLGYGISGGEGFIWVCLPYISADGKRNQLQWWGDADATAGYCKAVVKDICENHGGDASAVFIAGFSRGAIACNYIGLRDDEIAALWRGFICHSHYDGVRQWRYPGSDRKSAAARLKRLRGRPQFISHEKSVDETKQYLEAAAPDGDFTFQILGYRNHTDAWVLRDIEERQTVRAWIQRVMAEGQTKGVEENEQPDPESE